jgi:hypothetical protein
MTQVVGHPALLLLLLHQLPWIGKTGGGAADGVGADMAAATGQVTYTAAH